MQMLFVEKNEHSFLKGKPGESLLAEEKDIITLIGLCGEHNTERVLLYPENLPARFLDLRSGQAGMILQKCANYRIKVAAVLPKSCLTGKFLEFVVETNRLGRFRVFHNPEQAEHWLLSD